MQTQRDVLMQELASYIPEWDGNFELERETKTTIRYTEEVTDSPPIVGTIYVKKWALKKLNGGSFPRRITVTVEVAE